MLFIGIGSKNDYLYGYSCNEIHSLFGLFSRVASNTGCWPQVIGKLFLFNAIAAVTVLNVQFAYKRQNTGAGKSHFLHFLEVARQDALTKWRPNHEPPCLRYCHTFYKVFAVQASCSGSNTIVTLTETLLCLRGGRQTEQHRSRLCSCSAG